MALATQMKQGCEELQNPIGLMHVTSSLLETAIAGSEDKDKAYQASRVARSTAFGAQSAADASGTAFIRTAANVLRNRLGQRWSGRWQETGFPSQSTGVPDTLDKRLRLLRSLELYFQKHPDQEVASQDVTAAEAQARYESLENAVDAVNQSESDAGLKKQARGAADDALEKLMRRLVNELTQLLPADDPRWKRFGLNVPAAPEVPDMPVNVSVDNGLPGRLLVSCDPVPGANYYRFWRKVDGVDGVPLLAGTSQEPSLLIEGLPASKTVKVFVSAVNDGGESPLSESTSSTVLAAAA